ncbi:hypothetical protein, partial [Pseudomonas gingeri]|uniref:hypothetical protein n=2 Tax=Pseudomonas TaxID=286 RepID=UPI001C4320E1
TCTCSRSRKVAYRVCRYVLLPFRLVSALINWLPVAWHMWHLGPPPAAPQGLLKRLISRSLSPFNATSTYQKLNVHILLILAVGYPDKVDLLTGYKAQVVIPKTTVEWCSAPPDAAQEAIIS